jgi:hypothetical protein
MFRASSASPLWSVACSAQINRATSVLQRSHEQGILPQILATQKYQAHYTRLWNACNATRLRRRSDSSMDTLHE